MKKPKITNSNKLFNKAIKIIPGGTQTFSKGPSQFTNNFAPKYLKKGSIDVVLLSLDFADSKGITILRNIKKDFNAVRVLLFSYQPEHIYAVSGIQAGASGYLSKTATTNTIKRAILKVYKGGIYVSNTLAQKLTFEKNQGKTDVYNKLSTREIEVLNLICSGKKNNEMALELNIHPKTISTYKSRKMKKLKVKPLQEN